MEVVRPGIVQAVWAWQALSCFGRVLRLGSTGVRRSLATNRIGEFWSHSWHGQKWRKVWTAMYMKNTRAAMSAATLGSFAVCVLLSSALLPQVRFQEDPPYPAEPGWCLLTALVLYCTVFVFWRPGSRIFLDILCIDQENAELKTEALVSMGAFLKRSDALFVLWDPSYIHRLWSRSCFQYTFYMFGFLLLLFPKIETHTENIYSCPPILNSLGACLSWRRFCTVGRRARRQSLSQGRPKGPNMPPKCRRAIKKKTWVYETGISFSNISKGKSSIRGGGGGERKEGQREAGRKDGGSK